MIRGRLNIGDDYFHKGKGRWKRKTKRGWIFRSIAVMEKFLGHRINPKKWHVHHKNRIITDDRITNLQLKRVDKHISDHRKGHRDSVGSKNGAARLNEALVRKIRKLRASTSLTERQIGELVDMSQPQVHRVITTEAWSHVV